MHHSGFLFDCSQGRKQGAFLRVYAAYSAGGKRNSAVSGLAAESREVTRRAAAAAVPSASQTSGINTSTAAPSRGGRDFLTAASDLPARRSTRVVRSSHCPLKVYLGRRRRWRWRPLGPPSWPGRSCPGGTCCPSWRTLPPPSPGAELQLQGRNATETTATRREEEEEEGITPRKHGAEGLTELLSNSLT